MALPEHILLTYGYLLLFAWVLVEQLGVPLPAMPVLPELSQPSTSSVFRWRLPPGWPRRSRPTPPGSSLAAATGITCCACCASSRWSRPSACAARKIRLAAAAT
jgi:hypothetical protein